jgi:hypothetical protein
VPIVFVNVLTEIAALALPRGGGFGWVSEALPITHAPGMMGNAQRLRLLAHPSYALLGTCATMSSQVRREAKIHLTESPTLALRALVCMI